MKVLVTPLPLLNDQLGEDNEDNCGTATSALTAYLAPAHAPGVRHDMDYISIKFFLYSPVPPEESFFFD